MTVRSRRETTKMIESRARLIFCVKQEIEEGGIFKETGEVSR